MKCTNCGKENINSASFCKFCGHKLASKDVPSAPKTNQKNKRTVLSSVGGIVIVLTIWLAARYLGEKGTSAVLDTPSKQELVRETVQQLKRENTLPKDIDEVTTWTDVVEQPNAIRYVYTLQDVDESQISNESLKELIAPQLCQSLDVKDNILDQNINMEYSYQVQDSAQSYFFVVTKNDCT